MRSVAADDRPRAWRAAGLAALVIGAVWLSCLPPERATAQDKKKDLDWNEKRIEFTMDGKPWDKVFLWLTEQTGKPVTTIYKPSGSLTLYTPANRKYSVYEVLDLINEALLSNENTQKYILINRERTFALHPASEKIDPAIVDRIDVEDLDKRGENELVSVVIRLKTLVAEDIQNSVQRTMGPFGYAVAFPEANQLICLDTVKNLKRIRKTLKDIEENDKENAGSWSYECKYIKAREAERILNTLLGDPKAVLNVSSGRDSRDTRDSTRDGTRDSTRDGTRDTGDRRDTRDQPRIAVGKIRMHYITVDDRLNTVLVTGPANKLAQAQKIMKDIDVAENGQKLIRKGPPEIKTFNVPTGNAEALAKMLTEAYKTSPTVRIAAAGNNSLIVFAGPEEMWEITVKIGKNTDKGVTAKVLSTGGLDPAKVAETLTKIYGDPTKSIGTPFIEANGDGNGILVRGTQEQVADVRKVIVAMGGGDAEEGDDAKLPNSNMLGVITLDKGSAATLAEALQHMMSQMRQNPVEVIGPGIKSERKSDRPMDKADRPMDKSSDRSTDKSEDRNDRIKPMKRIDETEPISTRDDELDDPRNKKETPKKDLPGRKDLPVKITAAGNRLLIMSDDPKALRLAMELVRLLTTSAGEGDFEVIKLKNASAAEAAKVLDEAFNGPKQTTQANANPFFARFGASAAATPTDPKANRIRVVADPATNSLLVRANQLDLLTVKRLLDRALDTGEVDSRAVMRTWIIGPLKYATATEVSSVLKDVYREQTNQNPQATTVGGFSGFGGRFGRGGQTANNNIGPDGQPRAVSLSIGVDDRTNSLVLNCSTAMKDDVKQLVDQLELAASKATRTVAVIPLKGVDPFLVEQAIDAIQGRRTNYRQGGQGLPGGQGNFGQGNFGQGGFNPGGFNQGGFNPGGFNPGGFSPGGLNQGGFSPGGQRGMGAGGGGGGRGQRGGQTSMGEGRGGRDFFEQGDMDVPEYTLYDPQLDSQSSLTNTSDKQPQGMPVAISGDRVPAQLQLVHHEEEQQPREQPPQRAGDVSGPRQNVNAISLDQLGVIVVSGNSPADIEEIKRVIELIRKLSEGSEVKVELVRLEEADATSVTAILNRLYERVIVSATGNAPTLAAPRITQTQGGAFGTITQSTAQPSSVAFLPIPRQNAILVAAPGLQLPNIIREIKRLDTKVADTMTSRPFQLKRASASKVAAQITNYYASRYPGETAQQHQVRITEDESSNTVFVQAAPADMIEIEGLIKAFDTLESKATNDLLIVPLRNALSDDLATLLQAAIAAGVAPPSTGAPGVVPGQFGGAPGGGPGAVPGGGPGAVPGAPTAARPGTTTPGVTKATSLRFITSRPDGRPVESGLLEDIHIISDARTNSLLIAAPEKTMHLLLALIQDLDVAVRAEVKIFQLKKADAYAMANMLQQLFLGSGGIGTQRTSVTPGPGAAGGGPGGAPGAVPGATTGTGRPIQLTLGGATGEGPPLIDLRVTIDDRTNSLIVAGSRNDLNIIESIVYRLEDAVVEPRQNTVYHLRNATAVDVANALNTFIVNTLQVYQRGQQLTPYQDVEREVVVVPEPITNKLLISATPRFYPEVMHMIQELDADTPQVVIQVLIAEVDLTGNEEFGVEIGLQTPVLFQRGITPADGFLGTGGSISYANAAGGVIPPGVTVNTTVNPTAQPGFAFNNPTLPLGNNPVVAPSLIGYQGLGSLGVGRVSPTGVGGFVFSAASDTFNLLIRALKQQGRVDILSRPQVMTLDNQSASVLVGQSIPYITGSNTIATGIVTNTISYRNVGVQLLVTPRISPDGRVLMRVEPEVSSVASTAIPVGNGTTATAFNVQDIQTTVLAADGETVAIGGLISKHDAKAENKIPVVGDLPWVGAAFRYRTQTKTKTELLVIMTPHIVRNRMEADQILADESRRMDWILGDVMRFHGTTGMEPIFPPPTGEHAPWGAGPHGGPIGHGEPMLPGAPGMVPGGPIMTPTLPQGEVLPAPQAVSQGVVPTPSGPVAQGAAPGSVGYRSLPDAPPVTTPTPAAMPVPAVQTTPPPMAPMSSAPVAPTSSVPVHYNPAQPAYQPPPGPAPAPLYGPAPKN